MEVGEPGPGWFGVSRVLLPLRKGVEESPSAATYGSASEPNGDMGDPGDSR